MSKKPTSGRNDREEKKEVNITHQNAIFAETIHKQQAHFQLYTTYSPNPNTTVFLTGKPNTVYDQIDGKEDTDFLEKSERKHKPPQEKFSEPQTHAQEYGWIHKPLIDQRRKDPRLSHPMKKSDVSTYMAAVFSKK